MAWRSCTALSRLPGLIPAVLILAGCNTIKGIERQERVGEALMVAPVPDPPPPELAPVAENPAELEMPRVASRMPMPREPAIKKPAPPPKRPPLPKLADPMVVAPTELVGFDFAAVLMVLRAPDNVQTSALSVVWTYSQPGCTLQLFFYPDIQTKIFHLLKHDLKSAADPAIEPRTCMRDLMVAKNDEPAAP